MGTRQHHLEPGGQLCRRRAWLHARPPAQQRRHRLSLWLVPECGRAGDGGATIWLANSYWSDFDGEDERSWQARYSVDLGKYGLTGLSYLIAYVTGSDIKTSQTDHGHEHEVFNQLRYIVQHGPAKGLAFKLRASWLHVSGDAHAYFKGGKEVRVFVDYPLQAF